MAIHNEFLYGNAQATCFGNLDLAYLAMEQGGTRACALNASNEVAVQAFLEEKIGFLDLARINAETMEKTGFIAKPSYEDYVAADAEARRIAASLCE